MPKVFEKYTVSIAPLSSKCAYRYDWRCHLWSLPYVSHNLQGCASVIHDIKRVDRLLGSPLLHKEILFVFQRITQHITRNMSRVVILIDWSVYHSFKRSKDRAARAMMAKKNRQAGESPWLIFTNTTQFTVRSCTVAECRLNRISVMKRIPAGVLVFGRG